MHAPDDHCPVPMRVHLLGPSLACCSHCSKLVSMVWVNLACPSATPTARTTLLHHHLNSHQCYPPPSCLPPPQQRHLQCELDKHKNKPRQVSSIFLHSFVDRRSLSPLPLLKPTVPSNLFRPPSLLHSCLLLGDHRRSPPPSIVINHDRSRHHHIPIIDLYTYTSGAFCTLESC